jgi:tRNA-binding protein
MDRMEEIRYEDFARVEIRVGRVVKAEPFPKARKPAIKLWLDFGEFGERKSSAQITKHYTPEEVVGRLVLAVTNFPPRQIADFMSEVLVLGVMPDDQTVILVHPDREVPLGSRIA